MNAINIEKNILHYAEEIEIMTKTKGWEVLKSILNEEISILKQNRKNTCDAMEILSSVKKQEGIDLIDETISDILSKRDKAINFIS